MAAAGVPEKEVQLPPLPMLEIRSPVLPVPALTVDVYSLPARAPGVSTQRGVAGDTR